MVGYYSLPQTPFHIYSSNPKNSLDTLMVPHMTLGIQLREEVGRYELGARLSSAQRYHG
jgi:hypothetical protein